MTDSRIQRDLIVKYALRHGVSYDHASAELEFHPDPYVRLRYEAAGRDRPVRYERVQMPKKDYSANPGDYQGTGTEPPRAAGPFQPKDDEADESLDIDTMTNDPDLVGRMATPGQDGPRVRVYVEKKPVGDLVVTDEGIQAVDTAENGRGLLQRLIETHNLHTEGDLRQLPEKVGKGIGGLRAVLIDGGQANADPMAGSDPMADTGFDQDDEMDRDDSDFAADDGPEMADEDRGPMFEDEEEEEEPVRMSRRYLRVGDRLIYTKPIW